MNSYLGELGNLFLSTDPSTVASNKLATAATGHPVIPYNQVGPGQTDTSASQTEADILAEQMQNWQQVYQPVELAQIQQSSLMNSNVLPDALNAATTTAQQSSATMQGMEQRQMAARGIQATPEQQIVNTRMNSLNTAANVAGAQNKARQTVATQDELIAMGSAPNPNVVNGSQLAQSAGGA